MLQLLVDPRAEGAYFADVASVALAELSAVFPDVSAELLTRGTMRFVRANLEAEHASRLLRLSWVHGVFEDAGSQGLRPLEADPGYALPAGLVWGDKYRGKTHELVTQLALNVALASTSCEPELVLDPLAGRGTSLWWAARYGLDAVGVERDASTHEHLTRHVKRQCKLHRIKHKGTQGSLGPKRRDGIGRYIRYAFATSTVQLVCGDSRALNALLGPRQCQVMVADAPYGVQFHGEGSRSPEALLQECAPAWWAQLVPGGTVALVFNQLQTRRDRLEAAWSSAGLTVLPFAAPHRVSESILRDVLVARRDAP